MLMGGSRGNKFYGGANLHRCRKILKVGGLNGWGLNYTIQRFTPALTGRKECRGTLFPASVTWEIGG